MKLIWSREEDIQHDHYRPAVANRFEAVLGEDGLPSAWSNLYINVGQDEPEEAPDIPYGIANQSIRKVSTSQPIRLGPWRSVGHTQHSFFNESFVDELAHKAGQNPFEYRRALLQGQPRHRKVLETAAEKAGWGDPLPADRARGIALEQSFGSIVAQVAEVSLSEDGTVRVHRVTAAADVGTAVNPDAVEAQIQSGIIYGLTAALYGNITIDGCGVEQSNFHDYEMVHMAEAPRYQGPYHQQWRKDGRCRRAGYTAGRAGCRQRTVRPVRQADTVIAGDASRPAAGGRAASRSPEGANGVRAGPSRTWRASSARSYRRGTRRACPGRAPR